MVIISFKEREKRNNEYRKFSVKRNRIEGVGTGCMVPWDIFLFFHANFITSLSAGDNNLVNKEN